MNGYERECEVNEIRKASDDLPVEIFAIYTQGGDSQEQRAFQPERYKITKK